MLAVLALLAAPLQAEVQPPATVAVLFDYENIRPVLAEGLADRSTGRPVTADDPVRVASISKLVTALGVMRLVDQGKLDLYRDVSDYLGWQLRNPAFPDKPIRLRDLLVHQSSLVDGGELYLIPLGTTLRQRLSDPRVWSTTHAPSSGWFEYTNLNFPVIGSVIERVTGERFDVAMHRLVFQPLKLDACFNWGTGCSDEAVKRAVVLYRASGEVARDDLKGQRPACLVFTEQPGCDLSTYQLGDNGGLFSPQGGLRISMRSLARLGQVLVRRDMRFLSLESYSIMTGGHWQLDGKNGVDEGGSASGFFCDYGLAVQAIGNPRPGCNDGLFSDRKYRLGHSGEAYGLRSGLWWSPVTGQGIAFFTTAVPDDAPKGRSAFTAVEESVVERAGR